jgi:3-dehydrotetronate 4-kinase
MPTATNPVFGVMSDDFTGGLLVASYFEAAGIESPVYFDTAALTEDQTPAAIVILASGTRLVPPDEARASIAQALAALDARGCATVAYKACASFDSTAEGNIGLAADLLADHYAQNPLLLSAGFPEFRATVHQGVLFYRGTLVSESAKRLDPVTPMPDANLVRFLSLQTRSPLGLVSHLDLIKGEAAARAALAREGAAGHRHILLDCSDDTDVAMSVRLAQGSRAFVASDPLVIGFGLAVAGQRAPAPPPQQASGAGAVLVGSVGPVAEAQLADFATRHPVLTLDLLSGSETQISEAVSWAKTHMAQPFAITTLADAAGVQASQAQLGRIGAARKAEAMLAAVAKALHDAGVRRFVISGGETSGAVVRALGLRRVRALPRGPLGGGFCVAEGPDPISLFLKSGKLGADDVLSRAFDAM